MPGLVTWPAGVLGRIVRGLIRREVKSLGCLTNDQLDQRLDPIESKVNDLGHELEDARSQIDEFVGVTPHSRTGVQ